MLSFAAAFAGLGLANGVAALALVWRWWRRCFWDRCSGGRY
jgi:hypothetical protein